MATMVVAFDIETLGLLPFSHAKRKKGGNEEEEGALPEITCVCMHSSDGRDHLFRLWRVPPEERAESVRAIIALLDGARLLIGYNALRFDLEFMRRSFGIDDARMLRWAVKCLDPLVHAQRVLGRGCKLQEMLDLNGLGSKTASGADAIVMAREDRWDELLHYCAMDARLVYELVMAREWVRLTPSVWCRFAEGRRPPQFRLIYQPSDPPPPDACGACHERERGLPGVSD